MTIQELKLANTVTLVNELAKAEIENNISLINIISYELATRIYVPFNKEGKTFEDILLSLGYQPKEKENRESCWKTLTNTK